MGSIYLAILIQGNRMSKPDTVELSQDARNELMQRLVLDTLTAHDRALPCKCLNSSVECLMGLFIAAL